MLGLATNMLRFDMQISDRVATRVVQQALQEYPGFTWSSVEHAIATLLAHNRIDERTAQYVLDHSHHFTLRPEPVYFDVCWQTDSRLNRARVA